MPVRSMSTVPYASLLAPLSALYAQTDGIQKRVEVRLWIWRVFQRDAAGVPLLVTLGIFLALLCVFAVAVWRWYARQKRAD
jgi:hypothetical protein